jgi:hypothetical protein
MRGRGKGVGGSQSMSTAVHTSPNLGDLTPYITLWVPDSQQFRLAVPHLDVRPAEASARARKSITEV